jgi:hypothetical protein
MQAITVIPARIARPEGDLRRVLSRRWEGSINVLLMP